MLWKISFFKVFKKVLLEKWKFIHEFIYFDRFHMVIYIYKESVSLTT